MRVLVACEESQAVTIAFRDLGHESYSCDLQDCSGGHPEWHIKGDVLGILNNGWDLIIAHPPCTYLCNSGSPVLFKNGVLNEERFNQGLLAKEFFMVFYNCSCPHVCIENPKPIGIFNLPRPSQVIQPYYFGHPYKKTTYLWLKGLPPLFYTDVCINPVPCAKSDWYNNVSSKNRSRIRSKTFPGIAQAMACQWSYALQN